MSEYFAANPGMTIPAVLLAVAIGVLLGLLMETLRRRDG